MRKNLDCDGMTQLYLSGLASTEIASKFNVSKQTVYNCLKKKKIKPTHKKKLDNELVIKLYLEGKTLKEVAEIVGATGAGISDLLKRNNIKTRKKEINLELADQDMSYIAGMLDGEGSINISETKQQMFLSVSITSTNKDVIDWLVKKIGGTIRRTHKPNPRHKLTYNWTLYSNQAASFLECVKHILIIKKEECLTAIAFVKFYKKTRFKVTPDVVKKRRAFKKKLESLR